MACRGAIWRGFPKRYEPRWQLLRPLPTMQLGCPQHLLDPGLRRLIELESGVEILSVVGEFDRFRITDSL